MDFESIFGNAIRSGFGPTAAVYALLSIGLNVHFGYTGLLNFGQVGFMLVGAYGLAITVATLGWSLWIGVVFGILAAVALSVVLGVPTLRLRADYFAITTIAVAEVLRLVVRSSVLTDVTGGPFGLQSIANEFYALNPFGSGRYGIGALSYTSTTMWVTVVTWTLVIICSVMVFLLMRSPWGRVLKSIREDEDAARSLGKNVFNYKMQSLILGGIFGAIAGIMFAIQGSSANADTYQPVVTFYAYTILFLGGAASTVGPVIGAMVFWFVFGGLDSLLRQAQNAEILPGFMQDPNAIGATSFILVGVALIMLMVFRPQGAFGNKREMQLDV